MNKFRGYVKFNIFEFFAWEGDFYFESIGWGSTRIFCSHPKINIFGTNELEIAYFDVWSLSIFDLGTLSDKALSDRHPNVIWQKENHAFEPSHPYDHMKGPHPHHPKCHLILNFCHPNQKLFQTP